jgi:hypothetical protein
MGFLEEVLRTRGIDALPRNNSVAYRTYSACFRMWSFENIS